MHLLFSTQMIAMVSLCLLCLNPPSAVHLNFPAQIVQALLDSTGEMVSYLYHYDCLSIEKKIYIYKLIFFWFQCRYYKYSTDALH